MKFTLKDYQDEAVRAVLDRLRDAREDWHRPRPRKSAFSLTAATGAGKTVMAGAVFEALFHGDDERDFDPDPGAVVIWFSDDPSLNEQTRFRLIQSADRLSHSDMVVVGNTFQREKLQAGKIYFLNTQKLGRNSLLVRGHDSEGQFPAIRPDLRSYTIWDMIRNTTEDPALTLYLVLDEAHRGMGNGRGTAGERTTIVKQLINGFGDVPAIPVVWGISATVDRFNRAMQEVQDRTMLPNVVVDAAKVQDSGLLKDTIVLDVPEETGAFETVLLRRATGKLRQISDAWDEYAKEQDGESVTPLMVLQVPNTPDSGRVGQWIDAIVDTWPQLGADAFANVFGEHRDETFGQHTVRYIEPQRVQDEVDVRVLIAKDAISTGWDCPRAEVMVSFRAAVDKTHITQLLGRMVRTPLARRIPGNEPLNSVTCLLPHFNRQTVEQVADALMSGGTEGEGGMPGRRVLVGAKEMALNLEIPDDVWAALEALPSHSLPQAAPKPVRRLTAFAHELAWDKLLPGAGKKAHAEMHKALDAARVRYAVDIAMERKAVLTVEGVTLKANLRVREKSFDEFLDEADFAVIEDAYRRAARQFSPDLARTYAEHLADGMEQGDEVEALMGAHATIAAMGLVPEVKHYLDDQADKLVQAWFNRFRVQIMSLSDERQDQYRQIKGMSAEPEDVWLTRPKVRLEPTIERDREGRERPLPTFEHHLLCEQGGRYPVVLNEPERDVLGQEMTRPDFIAWYRNPPRPSQDSLAVAYGDGARCKLMRPDFLIFARKPDGSIAVDIVDPHGTFLADALPKLKGLAEYAHAHGAAFRRIDAIEKVGDKLRVLNLQDREVRAAVTAGNDAKALYESDLGQDY
ncbi:MAG TPA: DEAD/DEAH box helicase family protein [Allosphingosinicella sp.]|jgi:hypothetical protein